MSSFGDTFSATAEGPYWSEEKFRVMGSLLKSSGSYYYYYYYYYYYCKLLLLLVVVSNNFEMGNGLLNDNN